MTAPFPFVSVSGSPYERGRQHGAAVPDRVRRSARFYAGQLDRLGSRPGERERLIAEFSRGIAAFDEAYLEEMRGIADGAGLSLDAIIMINARTEIVAKARLLASRPIDEDEEEEMADGCTGAVILPERSATGGVIQGQNWDWQPDCAETAIVLRIRREDGPDLLTFVEAGGLGRHGMNAAGICVTGNYLRSDRDYCQEGVPLALVRRKALEQEHLALAIKAVATTPKACSTNMMLSQNYGFAIDFECAPDEAFPVYPQDGLIVHANHWISPAALAKLRDTGMTSSADSHYRDWRVRRLLDEPRRPLTREDLKAALFDDFLTPHSVCRPPRPGATGDLTASVAMILIEPALGIMEVAPMPALNRQFTRYSLDGDPVAVAIAA
ncbi:C45 family autoproteolytic acyltransferase/hydolase [Bosea sp. (in: a-proteobacteria)]|jgi:isopenicillin-N N-acyltransferase-like protein|uniref:C45 family autoproteolytic acyltransferase/hydolase n=1 Tax=Bosea sp. (in: a-proteobacteria) TaxID=1871050 RepID=UPI003F6EA4D1